MKHYYKAGVLTVLFTAIFLLLFPMAWNRWPTIFGLACACLFVPTYADCEEHSPKVKRVVLTVLPMVNVTLILIFCERDVMLHQLKFFLVLCAVCYSVLFVKMKYIRRRKKGL